MGIVVGVVVGGWRQCCQANVWALIYFTIVLCCILIKGRQIIIIMDNYQPCDLLLHIQCSFLDQDIEKLLLSSHTPITQEDVAKMRTPQKKEFKPKPKRELRLGFKSHQLRERFSQVIENVPGRVQQANKIFDFISNAENGTSSPLCLHGNTGCGKTSLITKVLQFFEGNSGTVQVAYLNCMSTRTVNLIYSFILDKFYGGKCRKEMKASESLQMSLRNGMGNEEKTKIIVLDQIDHVINEQNFLYNMLEWLNIGAKLILVLISNVIDLTVKLDSKLQSRWKFQTIIFQPYSHSQIESIIYHKYKDIRTLCKRESIVYISKRIYNINSDIRTLDKIYNRIVSEFTKEGGKRLLDIESIKGLIYDENVEPTQQGFYRTIIKILHTAQKKSAVQNEIFQRLFLQGRGVPKSEQILFILCDLNDMGLISLGCCNKTCDVTFNGFGIKINESLHLHCDNADYR